MVYESFSQIYNYSPTDTIIELDSSNSEYIKYWDDTHKRIIHIYKNGKKNTSIEKLIISIANKHKVLIAPNDRYNASSYGGGEIYIGEYDNDENKLISLYHELGHKYITGNYYTRLTLEIKCWDIGIKMAEKDGILFSDDAIKWGYEQALTYTNHDKREWVNYNKFAEQLIMNKLNNCDWLEKVCKSK